MRCVHGYALLSLASFVLCACSLAIDIRLAPALAVSALDDSMKACGAALHRSIGMRRLELLSRARHMIKEMVFSAMPWHTAVLLCEGAPPPADSNVPLPVHFCAAASMCLVGMLLTREVAWLVLVRALRRDVVGLATDVPFGSCMAKDAVLLGGHGVFVGDTDGCGSYYLVCEPSPCARSVGRQAAVFVSLVGGVATHQPLVLVAASLRAAASALDNYIAPTRATGCLVSAMASSRSGLTMTTMAYNALLYCPMHDTSQQTIRSLQTLTLLMPRGTVYFGSSP